MKKINYRRILPFFFVASAANAFEYSGSVESNVAYSYGVDSLEKTELSYKPRFEFKIGDNTEVTLIGRARADVEDLYEPGEPLDANRTGANERAFIGDNIELELLEAYLDIEFGKTWLRLGKQQIVWGQADGLKVLDVLNPQSFREFILDDFDDSRIALWTANVEIPVGDRTLQVVWIPDTTYDDLPQAGAHFAPTSPSLVPALPQNIPVNFAALDKPNDVLSDSDVGLKLSTFKGGWDLTLNYAYHYFDRPVVRRLISLQGIEIRPGYERTHLVGGTFSNAFGAFTVRGELGYSTDRFFLLSDDNDADGVYNSPEFSTVLGLDYSGLSDWFISGQLFQSTLTDYRDTSFRDETDTTLTALVRRNLKNETLVLEALYLRSLSDQDGLLQLSVNYQYNNEIELNAGLDLFHGDKKGFYGQFDNHDRFSLGVEVSF